MFIGEVEETGLIEPVVFPRAVPETAHAVPEAEPAPQIEEPVLEAAETG